MDKIGQRKTKIDNIWHRWTKLDKDRQNMANEARKVQRKDKTKIREEKKLLFKADKTPKL